MRPIRVVPHFHWDREWYLPFEAFRDQLVEALDLLLDTLATDESWTHFHLDGQTALIDDYLEMRPEREQELRAHIATGRLSCGPWVTLVDEFLVSGESVIRNLEDGMVSARELGEVMMLGYLPDQFGHVGQMPQLMQRAGIERVIVWRGVPEEVTQTGFKWVSRDGSAVEAFYLPYGYGNGRRVMREPERAAEHLKDALSALEPFLDATEPAVLMAGNDHLQPRPALTGTIGAARQAGADIEMTSLVDVVGDRKPASQSFHGELRSAARANLLPNTYSVRFHQKLARGRAEHLLERYAEPLAALVPGFEWPRERLKEAWRLLHLNGAHDSVCGCSTDEVAHAVDRRTERVAEIATSIALEALQRLASSVGDAGMLSFNPSPFERDGVPGLGWSVAHDPSARPLALELTVVGDSAVIEHGGEEFRFTLEDQGDEGDLYNFCPSGAARRPSTVTATDGSAHFEFETCSAVVSAVEGDGCAWVNVAVDNRAPDHRLRLVLALPEASETSLAASTFEFVRRARTSEGGINEPPSPCWPARGVVVAGGRGLLSEGVFEYELTGSALAMTLLRCIGTISRDDLATRRGLAGPDIPTPEAQMIGTHDIPLGLFHAADEDDLVERWERYALPPMHVPCGGGGDLPSSGTLLELVAPALSSVRRREGRVAVTVWNPGDGNEEIHVSGSTHSLGPHRIETITLE